MTEGKNRYLTIRMNDELRRAGLEAAQRDGMTLTAAVETFIRQYIPASKTGADPSLPGAALHKMFGRQRKPSKAPAD